jgi:hypothetical protein
MPWKCMVREVKLHALLTFTADGSKRSASCSLLYFPEQIPWHSSNRMLHGHHSYMDMMAKRKIPEIWGSHGSEYIKITVIWDVIPTSLVDRYHVTYHHIAGKCNQKYYSLCWELSLSCPTGSLSLHLLSYPAQYAYGKQSSCWSSTDVYMCSQNFCLNSCSRRNQISHKTVYKNILHF